jgi:hypothetical protein
VGGGGRARRQRGQRTAPPPPAYETRLTLTTFCTRKPTSTRMFIMSTPHRLPQWGWGWGWCECVCGG